MEESDIDAQEEAREKVLTLVANQRLAGTEWDDILQHLMKRGFDRDGAEEIIAEAQLGAMEGLFATVTDQLEAGVDQEAIVQQLIEMGTTRDEAVNVIEEIHAIAARGAMLGSTNPRTIIAMRAKEILRERGMLLPTDRKERISFLGPIVLIAAERAGIDLNAQEARMLAGQFARYPRIMGLLPLEP
ncbi:MAG: hypothetical protein AB1515_06145 [Nitrospirota bacterium]